MPALPAAAVRGATTQRAGIAPGTTRSSQGRAPAVSGLPLCAAVVRLLSISLKSCLPVTYGPACRRRSVAHSGAAATVSTTARYKKPAQDLPGKCIRLRLFAQLFQHMCGGHQPEAGCYRHRGTQAAGTAQVTDRCCIRFPGTDLAVFSREHGLFQGIDTGDVKAPLQVGREAVFLT